MSALLQMSVFTWLWLGWKRLRGEVVFPEVAQERLPWRAWCVAVAIYSSLLWSIVIAYLMRSGNEVSLRGVQGMCLINAVQGLSLLLAFLPSNFREKMGLRLSGNDVRLALLTFLASLAPVYGLNLLVALSGWRAEGGVHPYFLLIAADPTPRTMVWIAFAVTVAAPLVEELMYRVVLQGWFESFLPGGLAILPPAVLFAAVHWRPGRPDHLPLFAFALALGYLYHRRRSFLAVALVHCLFNAMNLAMALLAVQPGP